MTVQFDFRTTWLNGVLLSASSDSLNFTISLKDGTVVLDLLGHQQIKYLKKLNSKEDGSVWIPINLTVTQSEPDSYDITNITISMTGIFLDQEDESCSVTFRSTSFLIL
jgi:hypothetical protein